MIENRQTASCNVFTQGVTLDSTSTLTTSFVNTQWDEWEMPVTVTAGFQTAPASASATEKTSSSPEPLLTSSTSTADKPVQTTEVSTPQTGSPEASTPETGSTGAFTSQKTGASPSKSTGASPSQATGGVPKATGNAVIAGVAAVFGGLLMV